MSDYKAYYQNYNTSFAKGGGGSFRICIIIITNFHDVNNKALWRNGSASDSRSEGCVFKSRRGHFFFFFSYIFSKTTF